MTQPQHLDIDPEQLDHEVVDAPQALALAQAMPPNFNLQGLLRFLPDVRLKAALDAKAKAALAIAIPHGGAAAVVKADAALAELRAGISEIERCFDEPTSLANQLHKRLTGLRADFVKAGQDAIKAVSAALVVEQRRLEAVAAEARRKAQEEADKQAKKDAAAAVKAATQAGAPSTVVTAMREQAKVATAPPVTGPLSAPTLASSSVAEKWIGRFEGTPAEAEPNPEMEYLTEPQRAQVLDLMRGVLDGKVPLVFFEINWKKINGRAASDKKAFACAPLEAVDVGGLRAKPRR